MKTRHKNSCRRGSASKPRVRWGIVFKGSSIIREVRRFAQAQISCVGPVLGGAGMTDRASEWTCGGFQAKVSRFKGLPAERFPGKDKDSVRVCAVWIHGICRSTCPSLPPGFEKRTNPSLRRGSPAAPSAGPQRPAGRKAGVENGDALPPGAAGLLLTGGPDIGAEFLRQPVPEPVGHRGAGTRARPLGVRRACAPRSRARLPVFAICKGVQVLNVALGGTLHLDIPATPPRAARRRHPAAALRRPTPRQACVLPASTVPIIRRSTGWATACEVEAWSADDGIVEQVRLRDYPYCLGVQYHPERGTSSTRRCSTNFSTTSSPPFPRPIS